MSRDDKKQWIEKNGKEFFTKLISEYRNSMLKSVSCAQSKPFLKALKFVPCSGMVSGIYNVTFINLYLYWCYRYSRIWSSVCPFKFGPNQFLCSIYMCSIYHSVLCATPGTLALNVALSFRKMYYSNKRQSKPSI